MTFNEKTGLTTLGVTGNVILAGVIFGAISPWWLISSILCIVSALGHEQGLVKK